MAYFGNRRPRGFRHTFRFSSEQAYILQRLRQGDSAEQVAADSLRGASSGADVHMRHAHKSVFGSVIVRCVSVMALLLLLLAALVLFYYSTP